VEKITTNNRAIVSIAVPKGMNCKTKMADLITPDRKEEIEDYANVNIEGELTNPDAPTDGEDTREFKTVQEFLDKCNTLLVGEAAPRIALLERNAHWIARLFSYITLNKIPYDLVVEDETKDNKIVTGG